MKWHVSMSVLLICGMLTMGVSECPSEPTYELGDAYQLSLVGTSSGMDETVYRCPSGMVLNRYGGYTGGDGHAQLYFGCQEFLSNGDLGSDTSTSVTVGPAVGDSFEDRCGTDQIFVGADVRVNGPVITGSMFRCAGIETALSGGYDYQTPYRGGSRGDVKVSDCSPGAVMTGVTIYNDSWIGGLRFWCSEIVENPGEKEAFRPSSSGQNGVGRPGGPLFD